MNRYDTAFSAEPSIAIGGLFAGMLAATASMASALPSVEYQFARQPSTMIRTLGQASSTGSVSLISSIGYVDGDADVYAAFTRFYGDLNAAQRPLEPEFAKILFDNLWDLYAE